MIAMKNYNKENFFPKCSVTNKKKWINKFYKKGKKNALIKKKKNNSYMLSLLSSVCSI